MKKGFLSKQFKETMESEEYKLYKRGKALVLALIIVEILEMAVMLFLGNVLPIIVRIFFCVAFYKGKKWAKYLFSISFFLMFLLMLFLIFLEGKYLTFLTNIILVLISILPLYASIALIKYKGVTIFFEKQEELREEKQRIKLQKYWAREDAINNAEFHSEFDEK